MKHRKPSKGSVILMVTSHVTSAKHHFDNTSFHIVYWDKKNRCMFEEDGLDVTPIMRMKKMKVEPGVEYYQAWAKKIKSRSIKGLHDRFERDCKMFPIFETADLDVTEIGVL